MRELLYDIGKRLLTLLVIFVLITYGLAALQRRVPEKAWMRLHGIEGEVLYQHQLDPWSNAYILENRGNGTVSFAVVQQEQEFGQSQLAPRFRDIFYASEVRAADLELLRTWYWHYNERANDRIYWTEQHLWTTSIPGMLNSRYLGRGVTLEPERLEGQEVLFSKEIDGATVFCILADEMRSLLTEEELQQKYP